MCYILEEILENSVHILDASCICTISKRWLPLVVEYSSSMCIDVYVCVCSDICMLEPLVKRCIHCQRNCIKVLESLEL